VVELTIRLILIRVQPNIIEDTTHPAFKKLQTIGKEITQKVKPSAVVIFSAHWQAGRNNVEVNTAELTDLIYEYEVNPEIFEVQVLTA
jgi:4,5-DOPA dioxygenase extradiol